VKEHRIRKAKIIEMAELEEMKVGNYGRKNVRREETDF